MRRVLVMQTLPALLYRRLTLDSHRPPRGTQTVWSQQEQGAQMLIVPFPAQTTAEVGAASLPGGQSLVTT